MLEKSESISKKYIQPAPKLENRVLTHPSENSHAATADHSAAVNGSRVTLNEISESTDNVHSATLNSSRTTAGSVKNLDQAQAKSRARSRASTNSGDTLGRKISVMASRVSMSLLQANDSASRASHHSVFDSEDPGTRFILLHSRPAPQPVGERSRLQSRRLHMFEALIVAMTDSKSGVEIKKRKKYLTSYPMCSLGNEIVDWLLSHCKLLERFEALQLAKQLLDSGYLIVADISAAATFQDDSSIYSFQNTYFWPTMNWNPSDLDYAAYLLRRSYKVNSEQSLKEMEISRLSQLRITLVKDWDTVTDGVTRHTEYLKEIGKNEKAIFLMREAAFWRLHRPVEVSGGIGSVAMEEDNNALDKMHMTDSEHEATLTKEQLIKHLEKRLMTLDITYSTNRLKISGASKSLLNRCELWRALDPYLNLGIPNPFTRDYVDYNAAVRTVPTLSEVKIWCSSFKDLLADPLGFKYFMKFLESEYSAENLKFYEKCMALDSVSSRDEWIGKAKAIFNAFVVSGAPSEINIDAATRQAVSDQFAKLKGLELSVFVFNDAITKVLNLMAKDSFTRFTSSEPIRALLESK